MATRLRKIFAADKQAHFFAGAAIYGFCSPFGVAPALFLVCLSAISKELADLRGSGTPEFADALTTIFGGFLLAIWFSFARR
jgi:hypothetical protein